jgi:hypothetical protein
MFKYYYVTDSVTALRNHYFIKRTPFDKKKHKGQGKLKTVYEFLKRLEAKAYRLKESCRVIVTFFSQESATTKIQQA